MHFSHPWFYLLAALVLFLTILGSVLAGKVPLFVGVGGKTISRDDDPYAFWTMIFLVFCFASLFLFLFFNAAPWEFHLQPYR